MSKVTGPVLSLDAKGKLRKKLIFQKRPSGHAVYLYKKPGSREPFTPSVSQKSQRTIIGNLVAQWKALSTEMKNAWNEAAKVIGYVGTGYHLFISRGGIYPVPNTWADGEVQWSDSNVGWSGYQA